MPASNQYNIFLQSVSFDSGISVTFSESMKTASITTTNFSIESQYGPVSGSITYSGNTATFTPSSL